MSGNGRTLNSDLKQVHHLLLLCRNDKDPRPFTFADAITLR